MRTKQALRHFLLFSIIALPLQVEANPAAPAAKSSPLPLAPVTSAFGPAGLGFPGSTFGAMLNYRFSMTDGMRFHENKVNNTIRYISNIAYLKMRYGLYPGFDIRSETPIYSIYVDHDTAGTSTRGWLGDSTINLHKTLTSQLTGSPLNIALDFGATLPTALDGSNSEEFLGNRTWGLNAGAGVTWFSGPHRVDAEANFASFAEGDNDYRKPDRVRVNAAYSYAYTPLVDFGIESNYEWNGESERGDIPQDDSFTEWFLGPKFAYRLDQYQAMIGSALTFPVYRYYEATTPSDSFRFELKFSKLF